MWTACCGRLPWYIALVCGGQLAEQWLPSCCPMCRRTMCCLPSEGWKAGRMHACCPVACTSWCLCGMAALVAWLLGGCVTEQCIPAVQSQCASLTVRETFEFAVNIRLPASVSKETKSQVRTAEGRAGRACCLWPRGHGSGKCTAAQAQRADSTALGTSRLLLFNGCSWLTT